MAKGTSGGGDVVPLELILDTGITGILLMGGLMNGDELLSWCLLVVCWFDVSGQHSAPRQELRLSNAGR